MLIALIEDDPGVIGVMTDLLRHMGHEVCPFSDPRDALANISPKVDLVISDIALPVIDGFGVASSVHSTLGSALPRVLLLTGEDYRERLSSYPPSVIIGILRKPVRYAELARVISFLAETRTRCPGTVRSLCSHVKTSEGERTASAGPSNLCSTPAYGQCPHYNAECGAAMRQTVEALDAPMAM